jgi:SNF2 family DNA or RNA helicase
MNTFNLKIQRLEKQKKRKTINTILCAVVILFSLFINIYDYIATKEFDIMYLVTIALVICLISEINNLKKINNKLKERGNTSV